MTPTSSRSPWPPDSPHGSQKRKGPVSPAGPFLFAEAGNHDATYRLSLRALKGMTLSLSLKSAVIASESSNIPNGFDRRGRS